MKKINDTEKKNVDVKLLEKLGSGNKNMKIDTENDEFHCTLSFGDWMNILNGISISDKGRLHVLGVLGEWYNDIWLDRTGDPEEKQQEEKKKDYYSVKYCCERFENMHDTRRIIINSDDSTYNIIDFQERLIKGDCTHCMFCGTKLQAERL